jgi:hypothetical protein
MLEEHFCINNKSYFSKKKKKNSVERIFFNASLILKMNQHLKIKTFLILLIAGFQVIFCSEYFLMEIETEEKVSAMSSE